MLSRLEHEEKPVIAAIEGYCLGGAFELAMACDFVLSAIPRIRRCGFLRKVVIHGVDERIDSQGGRSESVSGGVEVDEKACAGAPADERAVATG